MVRVPVKDAASLRKYVGISFLNSPTLATNIVDKLKYSYDPSTLNVVDAYPGNMLFSSALYNKLQPSQHILLESRLNHSKYIQASLEELDNNPETASHTFKHVEKNAYNWSTYIELTDEKTGILHPGFETRDHIHSKLLLTGYLSAESLLMQWLACLGYRNWIQRFGNVRMLLWVPEASAVKVMAEIGNPARHKCSIVRESFSDTRLVATPDTDKLKKIEGAVDRDDAVVFDPNDLTGVPMSLLEINPKQHTVSNMYTWDYVTKNLMILRTKSVLESCRNLGPGADEFYAEKLPQALLKKKVKDLTTAEFQLLAEQFDLWPFKPDSLVDDFE